MFKRTFCVHVYEIIMRIKQSGRGEPGDEATLVLHYTLTCSCMNSFWFTQLLSVPPFIWLLLCLVVHPSMEMGGSSQAFVSYLLAIEEQTRLPNSSAKHSIAQIGYSANTYTHEVSYHTTQMLMLYPISGVDTGKEC